MKNLAFLCLINLLTACQLNTGQTTVFTSQETNQFKKSSMELKTFVVIKNAACPKTEIPQPVSTPTASPSPSPSISPSPSPSPSVSPIPTPSPILIATPASV